MPDTESRLDVLATPLRHALVLGPELVERVLANREDAAEITARHRAGLFSQEGFGFLPI